MSAAASPAPSEGESTKRGEVLFRFCPECSNLLYPKEDRATSELQYVCRACHAVQKFDTNCTERKQLGSQVQETAGVTTDVANDPTVGDASVELPCFCTYCGDQLKCSQCGEPASEGSDQSDSSEQDEYAQDPF